MSRTDLNPATLARSLRRMAGDGSMEWVMEPIQSSVLRDIADLLDDRTAPRVIVADGDTDCATGHCECGECGGAIDCWDRFCRHCGARMEDA